MILQYSAKKSYTKFALVLLAVWLLSFLWPLCTGLGQAARAKASKSAEPIVGVQSVSSISDLAGVNYIYFGRSSCPDCLAFQPYLEQAVKENHWQIYYFDTAYWKDDVQYEHTLEKFHVDSVPILVKTVNGQFEAAYSYSADKQPTVNADLNEFFIPKYTGLLATESQGDYGMPNLPVQFHDKLMALTFLGMLLNATYLGYAVFKKGRKAPAAVLPIVLNASVLIVLHFFIAGLGFSFALQYNASPDSSALGAVGRATWLTATPVLYLAVLVLAAVCKAKFRNQATQN